jgi:hypothetical protein
VWIIIDHFNNFFNRIFLGLYNDREGREEREAGEEGKERG